MNVVWKTPLRGQGHASPIVWGDRLFVCTAAWPPQVQKREEVIPEHHVLCYHAGSGKLLWDTLGHPARGCGTTFAADRAAVTPAPLRSPTAAGVLPVWLVGGGGAGLPRKDRLAQGDRSVCEARVVTEAARQAKVATQLGNQGQADNMARMIQEYLLDNAIGPVRKCMCRGVGVFGIRRRVLDARRTLLPCPRDWIGTSGLAPRTARPYHPCYHPWHWRDWWDFGTGQLGDLGCHKLSTIFKALKLGSPTTIEAECDHVNSEIYPRVFNVHFEFPPRTATCRPSNSTGSAEVPNREYREGWTLDA